MNKRKSNSNKNLMIVLVLLGTIGTIVILILVKPGTLGQAIPKEISVAQARTEIQHQAFVLDVREPDEYQQGHIAFSVSIPLEQLANRLNELPSDRLIIVVCRTGVRSAQGRDILLAAGFTRVTSLSGGMQAWLAAGLPSAMGTQVPTPDTSMR